MKLSSLFLVVALIAALVVMSAPVAKADGVPPGDPLVRQAGPGTDDPTGIVFSSFAISSSTGTSPGTSPCVVTEPFPNGGSIPSLNCQFANFITVNSVGQVINELLFDLPGYPPSTPVTCSTVIGTDLSDFANCSVTPDGGGGSFVAFTGGTGIAYMSVFSLEFDGFANGLADAPAYANVPEPASLLLLLVGFVALVGFGLKRAPQQA
jgi:hypothetical protein